MGTNSWDTVSDKLSERLPSCCRSAKACRERWFNHLDPSINKNQWSEVEEYLFIECHKLFGNKWSEIAKFIHGRTDNAIKNHFYSSLRKHISRMNKDLVTLDHRISLYLVGYLRNLLLREARLMEMEEGKEDMVMNDLSGSDEPDESR